MVGIAASGRTPFVIGALQQANDALNIQPNNAAATLVKVRALIALGRSDQAEGPLRGLVATLPASSVMPKPE